MKHKPPCERCGRPYAEHTITTTGAGLTWVCPNPKENRNDDHQA